ncbi:hypothetical protein A2116_02360 [Candidatus Jorgensenbacteria bacterium GWA1_49_17]|uniref:Translation elongation factor-like protein n=2 Tax=Candidatus Joergenseniibacteriota TaxID=1752739 RepID=A0A1F6BMC9_9BACT|nr:MAG: hypothetical protein A2127_02250 [Candidatus Jorgensenbacteria bacterium GWC1_48_12]OGG40507.1 MAG: hypothetical protein A2116_02360 [Candidatus Jorgensenbacteria bacterium GWA1_49_17]
MGFFFKSKKDESKPIGQVTHYYGGIGVAIIKFKKGMKVGDRVRFRGATSDFEETIKSMQFNHEDIKEAKKNQEVGIKVGDKLREGDEVFEA